MTPKGHFEINWPLHGKNIHKLSNAASILYDTVGPLKVLSLEIRYWILYWSKLGKIKPKILTLFWFEESEMWKLPTIFIFWHKENRPILNQYLSSTDQTFSSYSLMSLFCQKVYHCSTLVRSSGRSGFFSASVLFSSYSELCIGKALLTLRAIAHHK